MLDTARMGMMNDPSLWGDSYQKLIQNHGDPGILRPWLGRDGRSYITRMVQNERTGIWEKRNFVSNTPATLTYDAWKQFDNTVIQVLRERLVAFADLRNRGLVYNLPNGMAHTVLQYQTMGDITGASIGMSPARRSEGDRPESDLALFPLPLVYKDFDIDQRELMTSRLGVMPLDTTNASLSARKVAEALEDMTLGTAAVFKYAGTSVYGYTNHPGRNVKSDMTVPTGANGPTVLGDILTLRQTLIDDKHYGPYVVYVNTQWSEVLDDDFNTAKGSDTLRQRILRLPDIQDVKTADRLPTSNWHIVMVEMKSEVVRAVMGMEVQTVQWESQGGFMKHYKVICLQVPQIRYDQNGTTVGIAHGRSA